MRDLDYVSMVSFALVRVSPPPKHLSKPMSWSYYVHNEQTKESRLRYHGPDRKQKPSPLLPPLKNRKCQ